ncbi:MAG: undecaprenyl diphosphate synthase family protein, partial [Clostridium sp.]
HGLDPGLRSYRACRDKGVREVTFYGFTTDNAKRPAMQKEAFITACVAATRMLLQEGASVLVVGNESSPIFPKELLPYTKRTKGKEGEIRANILVNYGWHWDLTHIAGKEKVTKNNLHEAIMSSDVSRLDLIIRWGGRRRLSGFLPVQSIYADFFVVDDYWPDFKEEHVNDALKWYDTQDITLGG